MVYCQNFQMLVFENTGSLNWNYLQGQTKLRAVVIHSNFYDWKMEESGWDPVVSGSLLQKSKFTVLVYTRHL